VLTLRELRKNLKIRREKPQIWLLEKEKIGYIQIPKVATRSIQHALVRHLVNDPAINDDAIDKKLIKTIEPQYSAHMSLRRIRQDIKDSYFLFSFVRNPVTRI
jgi:dermatan 4-sulfotransferase 1